MSLPTSPVKRKDNFMDIELVDYSRNGNTTEVSHSLVTTTLKQIPQNFIRPKIGVT